MAASADSSHSVQGCGSSGTHGPMGPVSQNCTLEIPERKTSHTDYSHDTKTNYVPRSINQFNIVHEEMALLVITNHI